MTDTPLTPSPQIMWIGSPIYMRPTLYEMQVDDRSISCRVGQPFGGEGPIIERIVKSQRKGIADFYDCFEVWTSAAMVFECPAWFVEIIYAHNERENPRDDLF